jgi:calcium-dependent protein kinase
MGCYSSKHRSSACKDKETNYIISKPQDLKIDAGLFIRKIEGNLYKNYLPQRRLGAGSFGYVRLAIHLPTGQERAIKSISRTKIPKDLTKRNKFFTEAEILRKTNHPNILRLYEYIEDEMHIHLITEYLTGGELFDFIVKEKKLSENIAAHFIKQILSGVAYCHSKNIVHRDLKPENILLETPDPNSMIKIIDFGTSKFFELDSRMNRKYGTSYYIAPEVLIGGYTEKCDIWSCGVILYILLSGSPPFGGKTDREIISNILNGEYTMEEGPWEEISETAKSLIRKMLEKDPEIRISAKEALEDEWMVKYSSNNSRNEKKEWTSFKNLNNFHVEVKLQQAVFSFMSSQLMNKQEIIKLTQKFKELDKNGDGKLSKEELVEAYANQFGDKEGLLEVEKIMNDVDTNSSGFIDYTEFLMASSKREFLINKQNLDIAFSAFDADGNGKISAKELKQLLSGEFESVDSLWEDLIKEVDANQDGEIDINEFKDMMFKLLDFKQ